MHYELGEHAIIFQRWEQITQEQEGRLSSNGEEFLEAKLKQASALQAERQAYAYAAEEYSRARHHAAQVAQFAGVTQDLQGRVEHILCVGITVTQALNSRANTHHQIIHMQ